MELNLKKPLIFFDLETTGLNITHDKIIEICYVKVMPNGKEEERTWRVNPGVHIPEESSAVHGIYDDDVANCPSFKDIANDVVRAFEGCDIAGYNSNKFDLPMLSQELFTAGVHLDLRRARFIDVQTIFFKMEPRNLAAAYRFYCGKDLNDAHSASADTRATYEVLKSQLDHYDSLENDVDALSAFSSQTRNVDLQGRFIRNDQGVIVVNFGKYKAQPIADVLKKDLGYYNWMMRSDFAEDTKRVLTEIKLGLIK